MMNTTTDKQAAARHAAHLESWHTCFHSSMARHDAALDEVNRHLAARRRVRGIVHARRRPGYCKGVADAITLLLLAYIIGSGAWLCVQFLLSLIF